MRWFTLVITIVVAICTAQILAISLEIENKDFDFCMCTNNEKTMSIRMLPSTKDSTPKSNDPAQTSYVALVDVRANFEDTPQKVRDDYTYTPGVGSHKLHTKATTWNEARKICKEEGGHLAIINSDAEKKVLVAMLNENSAQISNTPYKFEALVGIHDFFKEGEWLTIFGEPLSTTGYSNWTSKWGEGVQPDNDGGNQHCGALVDEGGLDDVHCFLQFSFFCEIP